MSKENLIGLCATFAIFTGVCAIANANQPETYSLVYVNDIGHAYVMDHDMSYTDCMLENTLPNEFCQVENN